MIWLVFRTIVWGATLFAAVVLVRVATALVATWRPPVAGQRRRDGRWLIGWLVLLPVAWAVVRCEAGGFHSFQDPTGGDWTFDGHGWPLTVPREVFESSGGSPAVRAICWLAIAVDLLCALSLLAAVRLVVDRGIVAWDGPARRPALRREAAGWCAALLAVLLCERLAAQPIMLPGTEVIVYSTLLYDLPEIRAGILVGLASAVDLLGRGLVRGLQTLKRLHEEGVL